MTSSKCNVPDDHEETEPTGDINDIEKQEKTPYIVWEDVNHPGRGRLDGRTVRRQSRSRSQGSISSVRSRTHSASGIPTEFRTLSIQVSESKAKARDPPLKNGEDTKNANSDYFGQLDYHTLSTKSVCDCFNVFQN